MDIAGGGLRTGAVVALKRVELAKSRLADLPDPLRRRVAWTMAVDTLTALSAAVDEVVVVSDEPALESRLSRLGLSVRVLAEPGSGGMNEALSHGAEALRQDGCDLVVACVGDLPALRPASLRRVLAAAAERSRSFVSDADGIGTTLLAARRGPLDPHYQGSSARAHLASGALELTDAVLGGPVADARRDVDTEGDLLEAARLGLGAATAALIDPGTGSPGRYDSVTVTDRQEADGTGTAISSTGHRLVLPRSAPQDGLRRVRAGQRLHAVVSATEVLAAWL